MTGLILVGLVPFAALGIVIGHLLTPDSIGPAMGGGIALLALLGGTWFPIAAHGFLHDVAQYAALLLARAGQPRGARRRRVGHDGLGRDRRLDGRVGTARRAAPTAATPVACSVATPPHARRRAAVGYGPCSERRKCLSPPGLHWRSLL